MMLRWTPVAYTESMRPRLLDVTLTEMTLLFPGSPSLAATVKIRGRAATLDEARALAVRELAAMTPKQLELVREIAKPAPVLIAVETTHGTEPMVPLAGMIQRVYQDPRHTGSIHCPGCGYSLGKGSMPSIGYIKRCHACRGSLDIQFADGAVIVTFKAD